VHHPRGAIKSRSASATILYAGGPVPPSTTIVGRAQYRMLSAKYHVGVGRSSGCRSTHGVTSSAPPGTGSFGQWFGAGGPPALLKAASDQAVRHARCRQDGTPLLRVGVRNLPRAVQSVLLCHLALCPCFLAPRVRSPPYRRAHHRNLLPERY
jgi:hypothetical protein